MFITIVLILCWGALLAAAAYAGINAAMRLRIQRRVQEPVSGAGPSKPGVERGILTRWLWLAGYRKPSAPVLFLALTALLIVCGVTLAFGVWKSGQLQATERVMTRFPGGVLEIFVPVVYAAPWLIVLAMAGAPWLLVRSVRKQRVQEVEQDLPIVLELLATMTEAGLSFDAALDRVVAGQDPRRPLMQELRTFRAESLSGRPRVQSLRRLSARIETTLFSSFVSAVVQAEQVGAGIAGVLRRQADDVRNRRRENALEMAMALPVKRLVPMVICFLPGIMLWALGPSIYEFAKFVDAFARNRGLQ
jgi:tight adherence protein C